LLELAMLLGEEEDLVVEKIPVSGVLADRYDGDEKAGCSWQIRGLR
jgi:hypothetical protein